MSKLTLSFKGRVLKTFPLEGGEAVIGSDPDCDIHIDSLAVHARHAAVEPGNGVWSLKDLGSPTGTFVNGQRIGESRPLKDGDEIGIGKHTLTFEAGPAAVVHAAQEAAGDDELSLEPLQRPKSAGLQLLNGQNVGKTIHLNRSLTNLGKPGVQTAVIARRNEGYFLSHLEGENPPLVNGTSIGEHAWQLQDGDTVQIGNIKMQFYLQ